MESTEIKRWLNNDQITDCMRNVDIKLMIARQQSRLSSQAIKAMLVQSLQRRTQIGSKPPNVNPNPITDFLLKRQNQQLLQEDIKPDANNPAVEAVVDNEIKNLTPQAIVNELVTIKSDESNEKPQNILMNSTQTLQSSAAKEIADNRIKLEEMEASGCV